VRDTFKDDWDEAKERLTAWWHLDEVDRVTLGVWSPRARRVPGVAAPPPRPSDETEAWTSPDYRLGVCLDDFAGTFYGGVALPNMNLNFGPGSLAIHLGSRPVFRPETVWYEPCIDEPATFRGVGFDPAERFWVLQETLLRAAVERCDGRYLVDIPDLIENLDTYASLRGVEPMMFDLLERPDFVHRILADINAAYFAAHERSCRTVTGDDGGTIFSFFQVWAPGRMAKLQCDLSGMVSPAMFDEFVAPYLAEQCRRIPYCLFHLDGPANAVHLDSLLRIEDLRIIQWTPGAGQPNPGDPVWFEMYRRVLDAGKGLLLLGMNVDQVAGVVRALGRRGVYCGAFAESEEEARDLLEAAPGF